MLVVDVSKSSAREQYCQLSEQRDEYHQRSVWLFQYRAVLLVPNRNAPRN